MAITSAQWYFFLQLFYCKSSLLISLWGLALLWTRGLYPMPSQHTGMYVCACYGTDNQTVVLSVHSSISARCWVCVHPLHLCSCSSDEPGAACSNFRPSCIPTYSYRHVLDLSTDIETFQVILSDCTVCVWFSHRMEWCMYVANQEHIRRTPPEEKSSFRRRTSYVLLG